MPSTQEQASTDPTLAELIERFGTPPADVCLDWAFQIREASEKAQAVAEAPAKLPKALSSSQASADTFSSILVDQHGNLFVPEATDCASAIEQLLQWSMQAESCKSKEGSSKEELKQLASQLQPLIASNANGATPSKAVKPANRNLAGKASSLRGKQRRASKLAKPEVAESPNAKLATASLRLWIFGIASAVVIVGLGGWVLVFNKPPEQSPLEKARASKDTQVGQPSGTSVDSQIAEPGGNVVELEDAPKVDANSLGNLVAETTPDDAASVLAGLSTPFAPSSEPEPVDLEIDANNPYSQITAGGGNEATISTVPDSLPPELDELAAAEPFDVMEQLGNIDVADTNQNEISAVPYPDGGDSRLEPLAVEVFPVIQKQRVDVPRAVRVREPRWELTLLASEELEVTPTEAVSLKPREPVLWRVTAADADLESDAEIAVVAELMPAAWTLRWTVVLRSQKYPMLRLPLYREYLDQAETMLMNVLRTLSQQEASLDNMTKNASLPSDAKAYLRRRSAFVAEQLGLARDVLQIVLDGKRLIGWSDGVFEVYGEVIDDRPVPSAAASTGAIVRFGDLSAMKKDVAK